MFLWLGTKFNNLTRISLYLLYLLILVGGIVRCTGSGMGCPDWPKCFGKYIPPTSEKQLPSNYKKKFLDSRSEKNEKLISLFSYLGFKKLSIKIANDPNIRIEEEFNVYKTWTEYLNRLLGALVGLTLLITFISSIFRKPFKNEVVLLSFFALLFVIIEGWVGSIVVSTNLLPGVITFHVLLALLIICIVIKSYFISTINSQFKIRDYPKYIYYLLILSMFLFISQIILGTQVREAVDYMINYSKSIDRNNFIENLGVEFLIHRSYSLLVLMVHILILYLIYKQPYKINFLKNFTFILSLLVLLEILTGAGMAYFSIPKFLQPIHLFLAFLIFGLQFYLFLIFRANKYKTI